MNVSLTDHLVCPRCGPPFGLVLLARDVRDRRVRQGEFGCPNCRDGFPVVGGFGDLRPPPRGPEPSGVVVGEGGGAAVSGELGDAGSEPDGGGAPAGDPDSGTAGAALRLAAALGVTRGPGLIVVPDSCRDEAGPLARMVSGIEVVVVGWGGRALAADGVSAFVTGPRLPLRDGVARGVVAEGGAGEGWWGECLRVLMPGGRIVITGATDTVREWVSSTGLVILLDEDGMMVAAAAVPGASPRMGRWIGRTDKRNP
ncbi:MAG: hypothetical protein OXN18_10535 [Gemmatimonadota bacterium]|nr:hypothetical protein [Gemmatimonadota bacterium]